jgi:hypothetical protein
MYKTIRLQFHITLALILASGVPGWQAGSLIVTAASPPQDKASTPVQSALDWPRAVELESGDLAEIYQPQIESWDGKTHIVAWSAVSYLKKAEQKPQFGTVKLEAETIVATDSRQVKFAPAKVTQFNFSNLSREESQVIATAIQKALPQTELVLTLEHVLALLDKSQIKPHSGEEKGIKADPPPVFSSTTPAILINFDGEPIWSPIKDVDLKFAVNTNWDVFEHPASKTFYLRNNDYWLKATEVKGTWSPAGALPESFKKLPTDDNWKDVLANLPGKTVAANVVPKTFVSYEPAELILLKGAPTYLPVEGTSLLWVSNTDSDLFRLGKTGLFYYLVAGRWFSASDLGGPWTFATLKLPADFKKIRLEHPRSRVLASVPGTDQAIEAVLIAQTPQTARVNKKELKGPEVTYQGDPKFEPIQNTKLQRAVNTDKDVIKFEELYYLCYQGIWFKSAQASGPFEVATSIPDEIYKIPASSPSNHVTYVTLEKDDDENDDWVTYAAVAGYTGMMVAWGCAVWGTGWYYPPYYWYGGFYPPYFWYPPTYGFGAWYNPWTGTYGRAAGVYGPYGGAGVAAAYNPSTGTYARARAYGPYGSQTFAQAWNPRTGTYAQTRQGSNVYGNWGSSHVQRGDQWAQTGHVTNYAKGTRTTGVRGSEGGGAITRKSSDGRTTIGKSGSGDVYAGHDGNVYRKQEDGSWQKWNDGGWSNVDRPTKEQVTTRDRAADRPNQGDRGSPTAGQLDRDRAARAEGARRSQDNMNYKSGGMSRSSSGSYRMGGGGFGGGRGGGRR